MATHSDAFYTALRCGFTGWIGDSLEAVGTYLADSLVEEGEDFDREEVRSAGRTIAGVIENCKCNGAGIREWGWGHGPDYAAASAMEIYEESGGRVLVERWFEEVWDAEALDEEDDGE